MARLEIDLDGVKVTARFREDRSPITVAAMKAALPVEGITRHAKWGGPFFYLLTKNNPKLTGLPLEKPMHILPPGVVVFQPSIPELVITYDDVRFNDYGRLGNWGTVIAEIEGDLTELAAKAYTIRSEGEKPLTIRLID